MIKAIGCILILSSTTLLGFMYADKFKKRVIEIMELQRCIYQLQNEILYTHTPLPEALYNVSIKSKDSLVYIFKSTSELLKLNKVESVFEAFDEVIKNAKVPIYLDKEDIDILLDLAKSLGESDMYGQAKVFKLAIENYKKQICAAQETKKKYMKMYRTLGFGIGAMIVIVLV